MEAFNNIKPKNALHKIYIDRFLNSLKDWYNASNEFGKRSNEANEKRIIAEKDEWFLKMQCPFNGVCTTSLKRELNLFPY